MNSYPARITYVPAKQQRPVITAVKNGAMIGMTGATAITLYQMSQGPVNRVEAVKSVVKAGASVGLAAGAAKAAASLFDDQPVASLLASFAAGTAVAYAFTKADSLLKAKEEK